MRGVKSLNMAAVEDFLYRGEGESVFEEAQMQASFSSNKNLVQDSSKGYKARIYFYYWMVDE